MVATAMYGYHQQALTLYLILAPGTGFIPKVAGCGHRTTAGDGQPSTMAVGSMMVIMDGCGYPATNGHQPGLPGETVMATTAGLL